MDPYSGNAFFLMGLTVLDLGLGICGGGGMNEADLRLGSYIWMVTGLGQNPAVSKYSHLITRASNVSMYTWRVQRPKLARQCEKRVFLCAQDIFYSVPPMLVLYFIIIIKSLLRYQPLSMTHVLSSRPQRSAWSNILSSLSIVFSQHSMPRQQLRDHEMAHILISPVREMTSNTSQQGDIESAPVRTC